jgi:AraC-like DNA-binding protein
MGVVSSEYRRASLNLGAVARQLGISESYLCRVFKRELGVRVPAYIRWVRAGQAERLIKESDQSVKEIAVGVGFEHTSQLDRAFGARYGCSPTDYRAGLRLLTAPRVEAGPSGSLGGTEKPTPRK